MKRATFPAAAAILSFLCIGIAAGCGDELPPKSAIVGVRVLGVKVDSPYVRPGATAKLDMLVVDGSPARASRTTQVVWIGPCVNPKGDAFFECYPRLSQRLGETYGGTEKTIDGAVPGLVTLGTQATVDVPADAISSRPPALPGAQRAGRVFLFFAACAGRVTYHPHPPNSSGLPIRCVDPQSGADLPAEDFVYGYTPLFVFDTLTNAHPIIEGVTWGGAPVRTEKCSEGCAPGYACGSNDRCLPVLAPCRASTADDCVAADFKPVLSAASVEVDPIASLLDGTEVRESVWVEYAAINGQFTSEGSIRVVNDPTRGWFDDHAGKFVTYGSQPGEATLFTVVRDNRGGQDWRSIDVLVR
jgi:hypothetical protein